MTSSGIRSASTSPQADKALRLRRGNAESLGKDNGRYADRDAQPEHRDRTDPIRAHSGSDASPPGDDPSNEPDIRSDPKLEAAWHKLASEFPGTAWFQQRHHEGDGATATPHEQPDNDWASTLKEKWNNLVSEIADRGFPQRIVIALLQALTVTIRFTKKCWSTLFCILMVTSPIWTQMLPYLAIAGSINWCFSSGFGISPMCWIPGVPSNTITSSMFRCPVEPIDMQGIITTHEELATCVGYAGRASQLTTDTVAHEFVLQDLEIRVDLSNLPSKGCLSTNLLLLIDRTPKIARSLSGLATGLRSAADDVRITDDLAIRKLKKINECGKIQSIINTVFGTSSDQQIKDILNSTTEQLSQQLGELYNNTIEITEQVGDVQGILGRIKKVSLDDLGGLDDPRSLLSKLWTVVTQGQSIQHEKYLGNKVLLNDLLQFYEDASMVSNITKQALLRAESGISKFRGTLEKAFNQWADYDVQAIIERFESGRDQFESETLNVRQIQS